jgi:hypothetical protein
MQGKYILLALVVIFIIIAPGGASTRKISADAPVFIGESNVDLTNALDNCRIIAWWPEGADTSKPAEKNVTLRALNEVSETITHYSFNPVEYANYTGTWYCEEKKPLRAVFNVRQPEVRIRVWDLDNDRDVTGTSIPATTNVTYRIETNLDSALQLKNRPDLTPADGFWTVTLTDPSGRGITNIYTGSYGSPDTVILTFDKSPYITSSPYLGKAGDKWNRAAKNTQGELVYPPGRYLFTASQNLNGMQATYNLAGIQDVEGRITSTADVTFTQAAFVTSTPTPVIAVTTPESQETREETPSVTAPSTPPPATVVPVKTTYQPLPAWIVLAGLGIAGTLAVWRRK